MTKHPYTFSVRLLFSLMCLSVGLKAQVYYPSDSSFIRILSNEQKNNYQTFSYSKIDTSITNFQNYFPRNTNGNLGLSSSPLLMAYQTKALGFNLYNAPYNNDVITSNNVGYYQTKGPYASLTGIAGSKQEQTFKLLFSNTFKNKLNLTLGFNRYSGLGFFKQQQSFTNNFYASSNYTHKNNRVGYYTYFLFNKLKHQENGGIKNDSLFLTDVTVNKQLLPMNLSNAKREVRNTTYNLDAWLRLNKVEDSSTVFSHFINYTFNYSGNYSKYVDLNDTIDKYYQVHYLDTVKTRDSTHWRSFSNTINYSIKINPIHTRLELGFKNEYNQVHQHRDSLFMNNIVNAGAYLQQKNYTGFIKANYIVSGANIGDYSIDLNNQYQLKLFNSNKKRDTEPLLKNEYLKIKFNVNYESRHPDFIYNTWLSNHYAWSNAFVPTQKLQGLFSLQVPKANGEVGVIYQNTKNMLYMNELAVPQQAGVSIQNISLYIRKEFLFFKHLGLNAQYNYQTSSYQAIVSMPNHIVNSAIYYQGNLFKRALQLQIGFNVQYYNAFNGMAYMPATNMYYVQTDKTVGNYPFVDFFLNARIKPVRFFIKIDHLNQGFSGNNYYLTPGYLQNDRAVKFGLNWLFFD